MSKRTVQHEISDQGVAEVARIFAAAGWACDSVKSDYGEDLVCQTSYGGSVDPFRILVQVKSTKKKVMGKGASLPIKKHTLIKWLSDANLIVLTLWSIPDKIALYLIPEDQFGLYDIDLSKQNTFRLLFSPDCQLSLETANVLAWRSRLRNINRHFLETKSHLDYLTPEMAGGKLAFAQQKNEIQKSIFSIVTKFLIYIGLVKEVGDRIMIDTHAFIYELMHLGAVASKKPELKNLELDFNQIIFMVILLRATRTVPKVGFPTPLLDEALRYYSRYLFDLVRKDASWKRPLSKRAFETHVTGLAKRLWMFGSEFSPEQIARMIDKGSFSAPQKPKG